MERQWCDNEKNEWMNEGKDEEVGALGKTNLYFNQGFLRAQARTHKLLFGYSYRIFFYCWEHLRALQKC